MPDMSRESPRFVPAAGRAVFTRLYDPVVALTTRERLWRRRLAEAVAADLPRRGRVLDVGCGTGTLAIAIAAARPDAAVVGVDGDPEALAIAGAKPNATGVTWARGMADELPADDDTADVVVASLLLHHLDRAAKRAALREIARVLKPGGVLHVADWGRPHDPVMRGAFLALQVLDGFDGTRDHAAGVLPAYLREAGFRDAERRLRLRTGWGSLELLRAVNPARRG